MDKQKAIKLISKLVRLSASKEPEEARRAADYVCELMRRYELVAAEPEQVKAQEAYRSTTVDVDWENLSDVMERARQAGREARESREREERAEQDARARVAAQAKARQAEEKRKATLFPSIIICGCAFHCSQCGKPIQRGEEGIWLANFGIAHPKDPCLSAFMGKVADLHRGHPTHNKNALGDKKIAKSTHAECSTASASIQIPTDTAAAAGTANRP